jgi:hypothetical protein
LSVLNGQKANQNTFNNAFVSKTATTGNNVTGIIGLNNGGSGPAITNVQQEINDKIDSSEKGAPNGVAELDGTGKVPSAQLPSYVDDVLEYADLASFPVSGETGKIYIAIDTSKAYRWTGSIYYEVSPSEVTSVFGRTGAVTAQSGDYTTTQVTEGTNLYFTDTRARTAAVEDTIVDGVTNRAPSQNAVFDALATKQDTGNYITALTGDVAASGPGSATATIQADSVSNSKLANMATQTIKGRTTAGTGDPEDLTATQATAILDNFVGDSGSGGTKGLVVAPAAGDATKFLRGDATWQTVTSGGGGGSKNYLSTVNGVNGNGDFELGTTSKWSLFNTTLTSLIPTGAISSGAASVTTFNTVSSGQLAGTYSLQTASSGAWSAGQGFITDAFTIDSEDKAKVITFKAYYSAISGSSNINFSGTSSNTFAIYVYDVTNSAWIQPAGVYGINQSSGAGYVTGTFQTTSNSTQYRLAVLAVNASAGAVTMYWDDFSFGPETSPIGVPAKDLALLSVTATSLIAATTTNPTFGTTSVNRVLAGRIADRGLVKYEIIYTSAGTAGSGDYLFSLPSGYSFDPNFVTYYTTVEGSGDFSFRGSIVGKAGGDFQGNADFNGFCVAYDATRFRIFQQQIATATASNGVVSSATFAPVGTSGSYWCEIDAKMAGWSANVQMSNDTDTRVVACYAARTTTQSIPNNTETTIIFNSVSFDTHGSYNNSTGTYTAFVSGYYQIEALVEFDGNATGQRYIHVYKNGTTKFNLAYAGNLATVATIPTGSTTIQLNAGDTFVIQGFQNSGGALNIGSNGNQYNHFSVFKLSGPSVIAASETVTASYVRTTTQTITNAAADNTMIYDSKLDDSHGGMNTSNGRYSIPVSGKYLIDASVFYTSFTPASGNVFGMRFIRRNSSGTSLQDFYKDVFTCASTQTLEVSNRAFHHFRCNAGDTLEVVVYQTSSASRTTIANINFVNIAKVGN